MNYEDKEPGSWKIDNSAKWKERGIAEITFDVDSIMKSNTKYTDVLFVLDVSGSMTGEKLDLYGQIKLDYETNNHAKKYDGPTDTFTGDKDIYYYYGETPNNNVLFGGFCWRMYRTTDTGGVKMIYNGEPDSEGKCGTDRGNHVGYGSKTTQSLSSSYNYGTDYTYDEASKTFTLAGTLEIATWNDTTSASLIGKYTCRNITGTCSTLYYVDSYYSRSQAYVIPVNTTTTYSQIGLSAFNSNSDSLADSGYMYNKRYVSRTKVMTSSARVLDKHSLSTDFYYADSAVWGNPTANRFNLVEPYQVTDESEYSNLVGKYTFRNNNETYTYNYAYYICGVSGSTMYYIILSYGHDLVALNTSYYFADSLVDDGTGKQVLDPVTTKEVKATEWFNSYADYKNKYYSPTPDSSTVYYVTSTSNTEMTHVNVANDYMYGNSFIYDESTGMYTLSGETQHFYDWDKNYNKLNSNHYTCWNLSGICEKLSYIYYIYDYYDRVYYIELENGTSVEKAMDEMLYDDNVNTTNSNIKSVIDLWYSKNMIDYTSYFEDTVWCNSRREASLNGWNPNGANLKSYLYYWPTANKSDLTCPDKIDRFTVSEENGNGALTYPVGLVTEPERVLSLPCHYNSPLSSGETNWSLSPNSLYNNDVYVYRVSSDGNYSTSLVKGADGGARPAVSLRPGSGNGTVDSPYVIDMDS